MKRAGKQQLSALGYRELRHANFLWLTNEEGERLISAVDDWSPEGLARRGAWKGWKKGYHMIYLAKEGDGARYLVKEYRPKKAKKTLFGRGLSRGRREFWNTLFVSSVGIRTVLPAAFGERTSDRRWGVIIYPFLSDAVSVARIYEEPGSAPITVGEKQRMEQSVGAMLKAFTDNGMFPRDLALDQFLVVKASREEISVHWVDLERIKFVWFFKRKSGTRTLAKLIAQMEWLRSSGYPIRRSSMMRIARSCLGCEQGSRLDRVSCRSVIAEARNIWRRRRFDSRPAPRQSDLQSVGFADATNARIDGAKDDGKNFG